MLGAWDAHCVWPVQPQSSGEGIETALEGGTGLSPAEKGEHGRAFEARAPARKRFAGSCGMCQEACVGVRGAGSWHRRRPQGRVHGAGLGPRRAAPRRRGARAGAVRQVPGSLRGAVPATTPRLCRDTLSLLRQPRPRSSWSRPQSKGHCCAVGGSGRDPPGGSRLSRGSVPQWGGSFTSQSELSTDCRLGHSVGLGARSRFPLGLGTPPGPPAPLLFAIA